MSRAKNTVLFALPVVAVLTSMAVAGPIVEIPESTFDFGRVSQHAVVSHRFWIKSTGDDTLRIIRIESGCGCTEAPLRDSVLAPGDSTVLEILFSTKSYRGPVSKSPHLETNADDAKVYLKIKADLLADPREARPIMLDPYRLDVSQYKAKPRLRARFQIHNKDTVDYRITLIDHADEFFDVKLPEVVKAGDSAWGAVKVHESVAQKEFEHSLTFEINDDDATRYTLPVKRLYRVKDRGSR